MKEKYIEVLFDIWKKKYITKIIIKDIFLSFYFEKI